MCNIACTVHTHASCPTSCRRAPLFYAIILTEFIAGAILIIYLINLAKWYVPFLAGLHIKCHVQNMVWNGFYIWLAWNMSQHQWWLTHCIVQTLYVCGGDECAFVKISRNKFNVFHFTNMEMWMMKGVRGWGAKDNSFIKIPTKFIITIYQCNEYHRYILTTQYTASSQTQQQAKQQFILTSPLSSSLAVRLD